MILNNATRGQKKNDNSVRKHSFLLGAVFGAACVNILSAGTTSFEKACAPANTAMETIAVVEEEKKKKRQQQRVASN